MARARAGATPSGADLVLVQPDLALRGLEAGLDRPAGARHPHQVGERGPRAPASGRTPARPARPARAGPADPSPSPGRRRRRRAARKPGRGAAALPPPRRRSAGTSPRAAPRRPASPARPSGGVRRAVDQRVALAAGVVEEGPDPAGLDARPAVPEYCRCTPADLVPFLTSPVPSSASTAPGSPGCSTTYVRGCRARVRVPAHPAREVPHPVRRAVARGSRRPSLRPAGAGRPRAVGRRPPARPGPPEPRREPSRQPVQAARPPLGLAHVRQARPSARAARPNCGREAPRPV